MISFQSKSSTASDNSASAVEVKSASFCTLWCKDGGLLRFSRDEDLVLHVNIVDLLSILGCEGDCVPEGCGKRNLFDLKPNMQMTLDEGFGTYLTPPEVRSVIANCRSPSRGRVLAMLRETWPENFDEA